MPARGIRSGDDRMIRPVNEWPFTPPSRIASSTASAVDVLLYRLTVSRPLPSGVTESGTPSGMEYRSDGVPWIVIPWL